MRIIVYMHIIWAFLVVLNHEISAEKTRQGIIIYLLFAIKRDLKLEVQQIQKIKRPLLFTFLIVRKKRVINEEKLGLVVEQK